MEKIVIERNGVRHQLVKDYPQKVYCEGCSLNDICYIKQLNLCAVLGNSDCHFEIEPPK